IAVAIIATMAIKTAVTTCPCPRSLNAPNADIGATGCSTIIPYKIRSQSVSDLRNPTLGPAFSVLKQISSIRCHPGGGLLNRFKSLIVQYPPHARKLYLLHNSLTLPLHFHTPVPPYSCNCLGGTVSFLSHFVTELRNSGPGFRV